MPLRAKRHAIVHCLLLAFAGFAVPLGAVHAASPLRVMSFNVRTPVDSSGDRRWRVRREAMVALLRAQRPDVIGTQELVQTQADYLVAQLRDYRWFGRGRRGDGGDDEHMGVLYNHQVLRVVESGDFWLSDTPEVPGSVTWGHPYPRMVTWALFERRGDRRRVYLFNTHLPYRAQDRAARLRGVQLILARLKQLPPDIPVVVTGDFNADPDSPVHGALTSQLGDARELATAPTGPGATFHDFTGEAQHRIDWILLRGLQAQRFQTLTDRPGGVLPSDHFPVMAELTWTD